MTLEQAKANWEYWYARLNDPYRDAYCHSDHLREQEALAVYLNLLHQAKNELRPNNQ